VGSGRLGEGNNFDQKNNSPFGLVICIVSASEIVFTYAR